MGARRDEFQHVLRDVPEIAGAQKPREKGAEMIYPLIAEMLILVASVSWTAYALVACMRIRLKQQKLGRWRKNLVFARFIAFAVFALAGTTNIVLSGRELVYGALFCALFLLFTDVLMFAAIALKDKLDVLALRISWLRGIR